MKHCKMTTPCLGRARFQLMSIAAQGRVVAQRRAKLLSGGLEKGALAKPAGRANASIA